MPGFSLAEKREYIEAEFAKADVNGDGVVDFSEFCAFYTDLSATCNAATSSQAVEIVQKRREAAQRERVQRLVRQAAYSEVGSIIKSCELGDVVLVRAQWLLERAGYVATTRQRRGRAVIEWKRSADAKATPLPNRQVLETEHAAAIMSSADITKGLEALKTTVTTVAEFMRVSVESLDDIISLPVIMSSHAWSTPSHADPEAQTLEVLAAQLARDMPTFNAWGFEDVGVFFDWCSLYQAPCTPEQADVTERAKHQMGLWYSHRRTTVYLVQPEKSAAGALTPRREERGWPFFEETLCSLFKPSPATTSMRPLRRDANSMITMWPRVIDVSAAGAESRMDEERSQRPPISAPMFTDALEAYTFTKSFDKPTVAKVYRRALEEGYNGLVTLAYSKRSWADAELIKLAATLQQIACSNVAELDLSWNTFTSTGLDALGQALAMGSLHALKKLNLSHCVNVRTLPETIGVLAELESLDLSACIALVDLPESMTNMVSLRDLNLKDCIKLEGSGFETKLSKLVEITS